MELQRKEIKKKKEEYEDNLIKLAEKQAKQKKSTK